MLFILALCGSRSFLFIIFGLELLSWLFLVMVPFTILFNYLYVQSYFVLFSLMGVIIGFNRLIFWRMFMKMGLPPFHSWLLCFLSNISMPIFLFVMLFHKFLPLVILNKFMADSSTFLILFIVVLSSLIIFQLINIFEILFFSSLIHNVWMIISIVLRIRFFVMYWLTYSLFILIIFRGVVTKTFFLDFNQREYVTFSWLVLFGLPPFVVFWLKREIIFWLYISGEIFLSYLLIFTSVLRMRVYYRVFHLELGSIIQIKEALLAPFGRASFIWILF